MILVDDGSPDKCGAICDEYAEKDPRIIVIHQANAGVSAARNAGLDIARGAYIGFVDSDDWIEPEMYDTMIGAAESTDADAVICGIKYMQPDSGAFENAFEGSRSYTGNELLKELFGKPNRVGGGMCNKVFPAPKIAGIRFRNDVAIAEDWLFLFEAFLRCESGVKIPDAFYTVVERPNSATRNENALIFTERLLATSLSLLCLCRKYAPEIEYMAVDKYLDDCLRYIPLMKKSGRQYNRPYKTAVIRIKARMLREIFRAARLKLLPKATLHGHIYEWFKL